MGYHVNIASCLGTTSLLLKLVGKRIRATAMENSFSDIT